MAVNTIAFHVRQIYTKLEVHSKSEAVAKALREQSFSLARRIAEIQGVPYAEPSDVTPSEAGFTWPTSGQITSGFGPRWGRMHEGLDIAAPTGRPITAASCEPSATSTS